MDQRPLAAPQALAAAADSGGAHRIAIPARAQRAGRGDRSAMVSGRVPPCDQMRGALRAAAPAGRRALGSAARRAARRRRVDGARGRRTRRARSGTRRAGFWRGAHGAARRHRTPPPRRIARRRGWRRVGRSGEWLDAGAGHRQAGRYRRYARAGAVRSVAQRAASYAGSASVSVFDREPMRRPHLLDQPDDGALHGHPRGVAGWLAENRRHFVVALAEFEPRDDRVAILGTQLRERGFIGVERLAADGLLEWRLPAFGDRVGEFSRGWTPVRTTQLVANSV